MAPDHVSAWAQIAAAHAVLPADRALVASTSPLRSLVVDLALASGGCDELFDAWALLGRSVAQGGGSPSFASALVDGAAAALQLLGAEWLPAARAAVAEGFALALTEAAHREALRGWEFPACAVRLGEGAVAIAAGHPSDDDEELAAWAGRVAGCVTLAGIRRAVVAGRPRACEAVLEALSFVGVEANEAPQPVSQRR